MTTKIGILTSTTFTNTELETSFNAGWGGTGPGAVNEVVIQVRGSYDAESAVHKDLIQGVNTLNKAPASGGADVIVAVGGLVTAHAVVKRSKKPFIVLIGHLPDASDFSLSDNDSYLGGVDLHTVSSNIERRDALAAQFGLTSATIALLYNPNSRSSKTELLEWTAHGGHIAVAGVAGDNDENDFAAAFNKLNRLYAAGSVRGVVIAGDPFFSSKKIQLNTAANASFTTNGMKICYPFDIYKTAATMGDPVPTRGSGMTFGRKLLDAYNTMGAKAKYVNDNIGTLPFVGLDIAAVESTVF